MSCASAQLVCSLASRHNPFPPSFSDGNLQGAKRSLETTTNHLALMAYAENRKGAAFNQKTSSS